MSIKEIVRSFTDERWNVGFIATDLDGILNGDAITVQWLKHKCRDSWFADPFILKADNDDLIVTDCLGFDRMWFRKLLINIGLLPKR